MKFTNFDASQRYFGHGDEVDSFYPPLPRHLGRSVSEGITSNKHKCRTCSTNTSHSTVIRPQTAATASQSSRPPPLASAASSPALTTTPGAGPSSSRRPPARPPPPQWGSASRSPPLPAQRRREVIAETSRHLAKRAASKAVASTRERLAARRSMDRL